ncbi:MAG TPA: hypothetical protein DIU07_11165 [Rhodobacteraceae bacterium]|nr:hypothetical protein [Paracoccaceae bacterium]
MKFREITAADLPTLPALLSEGFPSTSPGFWTKALDVLSRRPPVDGMPRYGIVMDDGGDLCGVMLMVAQRRGAATFCNLSSWYVRPAHRGYAPFMFGHALKAEDVTFLDCSPTPDVVPIVEKHGFEPYSGGSLMLDARAAVRRGPKVARLTAQALEECRHPEAARIAENIRYGCRGMLAHDADGAPVPILYRVARVKRHIPVARFVYGAPETILAHAGAIARHLIARGVPLALVDWPVGAEAPTGRMLPDYGVRYKRGADTLPLGDLLDTEYALFGI